MKYNRNAILDLLKERQIPFELTEHPALASANPEIEKNFPHPDRIAKNLFVRDDKKKNYYLITVTTEQKADLKAFRKSRGLRPLSFGSADELMDHLQILPGSVSPFCLLNNENRDVHFFLNQDVAKGQVIGVHPNDNTATVWLSPEDLVNLLAEFGIETEVVPVPLKESDERQAGELPEAKADKHEGEGSREQKKFWTADLHSDTVLALADCPDQSITKNSLHIDLEKLQKGGIGLQTFALFTDRQCGRKPEHEALRLLNRYERMIRESEGILRPILYKEDLIEARRNHQIGALLSLEEGDVFFQDPELLELWQRFGVRMIALTWNYPNAIAWPNRLSQTVTDYTVGLKQEPETEHGLSEFGREMVRKMEALGILVDVSHLGDRGFWDVIEMAEKPVIASHSNSRKLCGSVRNLTDDMIRAIARTGGVIGLNLCADFLNEDSEGGMSMIEDAVRHIRHLVKTAGIDHVGFGSDFDGISCPLEIGDASGVQKLWRALAEDGFSKEEIRKIAGGNVFRVLLETLPSRNEYKEKEEKKKAKEND